MQRVEKALLYVPGGLTLVFMIVAVGWPLAPCSEDNYIDWFALGVYLVLSAWVIAGAIYLWRMLRRDDDFKPWQPEERKPVDVWTPPEK